MRRRQFLTTFAALIGVAGLQPANFSFAAAAASKRLQKTRIVIDALSSPADFGDPLPLSADAIRDIRASGLTAINWTVSSRTFEDTVSQMAFAQAVVDSDPALWTLVRKHSDIGAAAVAGQVAIMPGFQYTMFLEENPDRIAMFRKLGVRIMQITYNNRSLFGDGCLEPANGGLSRAGRALIERMNSLGVAVDLGHAGMRTTAETIAASKRPALITHTGCRALHEHPRNQTDENLKALADRGGVVGIYFMPYLVASPTVPTTEHVCNHLVHALDVAGTDHVGIGSDGAIAGSAINDEQRKAMELDMAERKRLGVAAPEEDRFPLVPELNTPKHMEMIAGKLKEHGYKMAVVDKVLGENVHRVLGDIWGTV